MFGQDPMEQHRRAMEEHNRIIQQMHGQQTQFGFPNAQTMTPAQQLMLQQQQIHQQQMLQQQQQIPNIFPNQNLTPAQQLMLQQQQIHQQQMLHQHQQLPNVFPNPMLNPSHQLMLQQQQIHQQQMQQQQLQQQQLQLQGGGSHFSSSSSSSFNDGSKPVYYTQSTVSKTAPDGTAQTLSIEHNSASGETKKVVKRAIGDKAVEDVEISDGRTGTRVRKIQNMDPHDHYGFEESWDAKAARLNSGGSAIALSANSGPDGIVVSGVAAPQVRIQEASNSSVPDNSIQVASVIDEPDD